MLGLLPTVAGLFLGALPRALAQHGAGSIMPLILSSGGSIPEPVRRTPGPATDSSVA